MVDTIDDYVGILCASLGLASLLISYLWGSVAVLCSWYGKKPANTEFSAMDWIAFVASNFLGWFFFGVAKWNSLSHDGSFSKLQFGWWLIATFFLICVFEVVLYIIGTKPLEPGMEQISILVAFFLYNGLVYASFFRIMTRNIPEPYHILGYVAVGCLLSANIGWFTFACTTSKKTYIDVSVGEIASRFIGCVGAVLLFTNIIIKPEP